MREMLNWTLICLVLAFYLVKQSQVNTKSLNLNSDISIVLNRFNSFKSVGLEGEEIIDGMTNSKYILNKREVLQLTDDTDAKNVNLFNFYL